MSKSFSARRAAIRARSRQQALLLVVFGIVCLLAAWLLHPSTNAYPLGVFVLGAGMLIASLLNPYRLVTAGWMVTLLGIAVFLFFGHLIPVYQVFPVYIISLGVGLIIVALMGRRGYVKAGAVTPGIIVLVVGIVEYLLLANLTPAGFVGFMLSLWLPGIGLVILGLVYLAVSMRD